MDRNKVVNWLIALTVAMGRLCAPLSGPGMAMPQATPAEDGMAATTADMPCCPDQQEQKAKDCGSCPFVALCMLTITMPAPDVAGVLIDRRFSRNACARM